ncbi:MAG: twin-arginine translocase TatA/TatE family subunit [Candidatus Eremiobacteraeota bacterium]|nr:twin-arginine translocase TatA/TatE family subunit [Candidatus Eremiobacteraeota bacterium]
MFNLGPMEIALILILALLIFGPSRLMELSRSIGKAIHEFRTSMEGKTSEEETLREENDNKKNNSSSALAG